MEGEWSCYRGGQFEGGSMVMLHFNRRENGHVKEVVFNGVRMVMLQRRSIYWRENARYGGGQFKWRENGHSMEVASLMEGE